MLWPGEPSDVSDRSHPDPTATEELVDVLDERGEVTGVVPRSVMRNQRLRHRCVFIAVWNSRSELLIHQRSATKDLWPGYWDVAVGGVVLAGETWEHAAERELAEELGVTGVALRALTTGEYCDDDVAVVGQVWATTSDGPFSCPDGEVAATRWVDHSTLQSMLGTERFCPDSLAIVLPALW